MESHHSSSILHFTHLYFVDYMLEGNILQLMQKWIRLLLICDETLFLITVPFSRKSQRKWCPAVLVYLSEYSHLLWLDNIFHEVKCASREKSATVLTYNSAVKCQPMSGGRWTGIWSERCIKVGLDQMRLLTLLPFRQLMHCRCFRKVSVLHVCHVNIHKYDIHSLRHSLLEKYNWWLQIRYSSQLRPRHQCHI